MKSIDAQGNFAKLRAQLQTVARGVHLEMRRRSTGDWPTVLVTQVAWGIRSP